LDRIVLTLLGGKTTQLDDFGKTAQSLARNPLGIIALFIVLLYAIAGLILGVSATKLESSERLPLVWFIVIFPVMVLAVFSWFDHGKLVAIEVKFFSQETFRKNIQNRLAEISSLALKITAMDSSNDTKLLVAIVGRD